MSSRDTPEVGEWVLLPDWGEPGRFCMGMVSYLAPVMPFSRPNGPPVPWVAMFERADESGGVLMGHRPVRRWERLA